MSVLFWPALSFVGGVLCVFVEPRSLVIGSFGFFSSGLALGAWIALRVARGSP